MTSSTRRRRIAALGIAVSLGLGAVVIAESNAASVQASDSYQGQRQQFDSDTRGALAQGFTAQDLQAVVDRETAIEATPQPFWIGNRAAFYQAQAESMGQLRVRFQGLLVKVMDDARSAAEQSVAADQAQIAADRRLGADDTDLGPLQARADELGRQLAQARLLTDYRELGARAGALGDDANRIAAAQAAENAEIAKVAAQLQAQYGTPEAVRQAAQAVLGNERDEATAAGFLNQQGNFKGYDSLTRLLSKMERAAAGLGSADAAAAATAAAGVMRYGGQLHGTYGGGLPAKAIIVSIADQHLWAYDAGRPVMDTVVTTGRPALSTDIGPMKILYRQSPFKMVSPWPKTSPFYYPPTDVRKVLWFSDTGEGLHDAPWRSWYGPGSNIGDGTHGCINLPGNTVDFLFDWAPDGTPVIVIPGTGDPQPTQLAQDSIDTPAGNSIKGL